jgi:hypothetical protein
MFFIKDISINDKAGGAMAVDAAGRRATRIAKIATDVLWWAGLALAPVLGLGILLSPVLARDAGFQLGVGVPVSIGADTSGAVRLASADTMVAVRVVVEAETHRQLEFDTRSGWFFMLAHVTFLPILVAALAGVRLLRLLLADVLAGRVFTARNATRLSWVGWLTIVLSIAGPLHDRWRSELILGRLRLSGATIAPADGDGNGLWLIGVLLLVVASVWRYGAELQEERDLTV